LARSRDSGRDSDAGGVFPTTKPLFPPPALVAQGLVDVASIVTHRFPLQRAADAFQAAKRREGLKVILEV
jgi:threonine dehydrogenase-like Zn-dependent dehydrogenase